MGKKEKEHNTCPPGGAEIYLERGEEGFVLSITGDTLDACETHFFKVLDELEKRYPPKKRNKLATEVL